MDNVSVLVDALNEKFSGRITGSADGKAVIIPADDLLAALKVLKEEQDLSFLVDLTAVDYPENFEMVYHLMSLMDGDLVRVKVILPKEDPKIDSVVSLWKSANVMERETWDLLGVVFEGHPDLKRILCPDDFTGHPLRKDFIVAAGVRR